MEHFARKLEAGAVAGAVPGPVRLIPADDATHMAANRGDGMDDAILILKRGDPLAVDLHNRRIPES